MSELGSELAANYKSFRGKLRKDFSAADKTLDPNGTAFFEAYRGLASINSWRADVLARKIPDGALGFMLEAQNDGLSSMSFATVGAWRIALQSLRSMIENTLMCLYFSDHPIEYRLWSVGKFKIGFGELIEYFRTHPANTKLAQPVDPIPVLRSEYDTLSKAVHGRAPFRMTKDTLTTVVCNSNLHLRGAYMTRQRETIRALCLILLMIFSEELTGTKQQELRKLLSLIYSTSVRNAVKKQYGIII